MGSDSISSVWLSGKGVIGNGSNVNTLFDCDRPIIFRRIIVCLVY